MTAQVFEAAIEYRPASSGYFFWERFDLYALRADFDRALHARLSHLQLSLTWNDFQPDPDRVAVPPMRDLERTLEMAMDRGIRVRVCLFPVRGPACLLFPG